MSAFHPLDPFGPVEYRWPSESGVCSDDWALPDERDCRSLFLDRHHLRPSDGQPKRNHHYIPQFWLKGFTATTGRKHLGRVDFEKCRFNEGSTKKFASEMDLYDIGFPGGGLNDSVENMFGSIENDAAIAVQELLSSRRPSQQSRYALSVFLVLQGARIPHHSPRMASRSADDWTSQIVGMTRELDDRGIDYPHREALHRYEVEGWHQHVGKLMFYRDLLWAACDTAQRIFRRRWSLVDTTKGDKPVLLSDNPVPALPLGNCTVTFLDGSTKDFPSLIPLARSRILCVHDDPDDSLLQIESSAVIGQLIGLSNHWQLTGLHRYLFVAPEDARQFRNLERFGNVTGTIEALGRLGASGPFEGTVCRPVPG
jgi:Protein of unknown function (DUF4238)